MSRLNAVFLITSGCLSHSGRSAETNQSSQPSSRPFLWIFIVIDPLCHFLTPSSVVEPKWQTRIRYRRILQIPGRFANQTPPIIFQKRSSASDLRVTFGHSQDKVSEDKRPLRECKNNFICNTARR
ncbi:hypothetical protein PoB_000590900 [Plakobranchus ocellatus]|uniref:Secreted protein n=1 Tax=Plakobranchus ocellatus TaxID=259542 RepID=A0AAV3YBD8_9GAST|nr:hypothetical protein PoB_000590900 [Plakobranchus ocellatus]